MGNVNRRARRTLAQAQQPPGAPYEVRYLVGKTKYILPHETLANALVAKADLVKRGFEPVLVETGRNRILD